MQSGQLIWAIDPCETFGGQHTLTVGKSYVIEDADDYTIVFIDDLRKSHPMAKINASRFFSLTPPKEKEGVILKDKASVSMKIDGEFRSNGYIYFEIEDGDELQIVEISPTQATQLRDHLTEALNKLK